MDRTDTSIIIPKHFQHIQHTILSPFNCICIAMILNVCAAMVATTRADPTTKAPRM